MIKILNYGVLTYAGLKKHIFWSDSAKVKFLPREPPNLVSVDRIFCASIRKHV